MSWGKKGKPESGITAAGEQSLAERQAEDRAREIDELMKGVYKGRMGLGEYPSGYVSPEESFKRSGELAKTLYGQVLTETQDPYAFYQSTLEPQMNLALDAISRYFAGKGLVKSGMNVEAGSRAGMELAVASARERLNQRNQALARAAGLEETMYGREATNLAGLSELAGRSQQLGYASRGRAAEYASAPYESQLADIYSARQSMYALPGQVIGAVGNIASYGTNPLQASYDALKKLGVKQGSYSTT